MQILKKVPLAPLTTMGVGGDAQRYCRCRTIDDIQKCLEFAGSNNFPVFILGGGSNIIFSDHGFAGLVIHIALQGIETRDDGNSVILTAQAGVVWDDLVSFAVIEGYSGIECLSGIPGFTGAAPVQNIGAYGQEVKDTIVSVTVLERSTGEIKNFSSADCTFEYRQSIFKNKLKDRFIVTAVSFRLAKNGKPVIRYPELLKHLETAGSLSSLENGTPALRIVRDAVAALRRKKSMLFDPSDPNSRSAGSFFMNPLVSADEFQILKQNANDAGMTGEIPFYIAGSFIKVPAAWLIEHAGYYKGFRKGGAGISEHHALAIVNRGGTAAEILSFAEEIQEAVFKKFGVRMEREAVVVE